jgi:hypothetical protein
MAHAAPPGVAPPATRAGCRPRSTPSRRTADFDFIKRSDPALEDPENIYPSGRRVNSTRLGCLLDARIGAVRTLAISQLIEAPGTAPRDEQVEECETIEDTQIAATGQREKLRCTFTIKYATAISPKRMNATGRVNRPRMISVLPTVSKLAASPGFRLNRL